jgi:hypothetical protein
VTKSKPLPAAELLWDELTYNPVDGALYWQRKKPGRSCPLSQRIGYQNKSGYWRVKLCYRQYFQHLLVWKWVTGEDVPGGYQVDHIDMNPANNAWSNLRLLTNASNRMNNTGRGYGFYPDLYWQRPWKVGAYVALGRTANEWYATEEEAARRVKEIRRVRIGECEVVKVASKP